MAPSKPRGGSHGRKKSNSSKKISSDSSNPTATHSPPSVIRPLPQQYTNSPNQVSSAYVSASASATASASLSASASRRSTGQPRTESFPVQPVVAQHTPTINQLEFRPTNLAANFAAEEAEENNEDSGSESESEEVPATGGQFSLEQLLSIPGRENHLKRLSPYEGQGLWFTRETSLLVKKISRILISKFDKAYYNWSCTPTPVRDSYFIKFAQKYTWDPVITDVVREWFEEIAQRRLRGLISYVRRTRNQPAWIGDTLWAEMCEYWDSAPAKKKSKNASASRNSNRGGLGIHKHVGGPKSNAEIEREMEKKLGRPVSYGEVFLKTHTRKDGTYVDEKAKQVAEAYDQKLQEKLSEAGIDPSMTSDGATTQLSTAQMNEVFKESTIADERGNLYGLGSLAKVHGKRKQTSELPDSSPCIIELQQKLDEANTKIANQEARERARDAEKEEQDAKWDKLMRYLNKKDPGWMESDDADLL